MRKLGLCIALFVSVEVQAAPLAYPVTERGTETETKFGTPVSDPYRWLEGDLRTDARVRSWINEQHALTDAYLAGLSGRDSVRERLREAWNIEKVGSPRKRGNRLFFDRNNGVQSQNSILVQEGLTGQPRLLLDPNTLSTGGELIVRDWAPSPDGKVIAYTTQRNGADRQTIHFLDVATGRTLSDVAEGTIVGLFAWHPNGSGLFYTYLDPPAEAGMAAMSGQTSVRFHRLGSAASDPEIYRGQPSDRLLTVPRTTFGGRWLVVLSSDPGGTRNKVQVLDLSKPGSPLLPLVAGIDSRWVPIGEQGGELLFVTNSGAARERVVALRPAGGLDQRPRLVVPEGEQPIRKAIFAGDGVVVQYLDGLSSTLRQFSLRGAAPRAIPIDAGMIVDQVEGQPGDSQLFFLGSSTARPPTAYRHDLASRTRAVFKAPRISWNPDDFVLRQSFAVSKDGTRIPVTIASRADLDPSRPHPTILNAYGGFGLSPGLNFNEVRLAWLNMGGVFAVAHVRGGAEFGKEWHEAAKKGGRLKTIEDFVAAAELLNREGVSSPEKLVSYGSSNGGLLVTAATNARPDLFRATIARVPVTDMLRYTRFTMGRIWIDELGDPDDPADFKALLAYSPLHNIKGGNTYPAILVQTADSDDRVVPAHSFKYIAALQAADLGDRPRLIRIEPDAGHGDAKPIGKLIAEFADLWSFAAEQTGLGIRPR